MPAPMLLRLLDLRAQLEVLHHAAADEELILYASCSGPVVVPTISPPSTFQSSGLPSSLRVAIKERLEAVLSGDGGKGEQ